MNSCDKVRLSYTIPMFSMHYRRKWQTGGTQIDDLIECLFNLANVSDYSIARMYLVAISSCSIWHRNVFIRKMCMRLGESDLIGGKRIEHRGHGGMRS